jgi:agmatinase
VLRWSCCTTAAAEAGVALLQDDLLAGHSDLQLPGQDVDELHVGGQRVGVFPAAAAGLDVGQDGLHALLPGWREQVFGHLLAAEVDRQVGAVPGHLAGADIVEVAPAYDHAQITGIAAAHVGYELLSALAARKGPTPPQLR